MPQVLQCGRYRIFVYTLFQSNQRFYKTVTTKGSDPAYPAFINYRGQGDCHQNLVDPVNYLFCKADLKGSIPNFMELYHTVGKDKLKDRMMFWRFIYFAAVFKPAHLVMLLPGNIAMNECRTKIAAGKLEL